MQAILEYNHSAIWLITMETGRIESCIKNRWKKLKTIPYISLCVLTSYRSTYCGWWSNMKAMPLWWQKCISTGLVAIAAFPSVILIIADKFEMQCWQRGRAFFFIMPREVKLCRMVAGCSGGFSVAGCFNMNIRGIPLKASYKAAFSATNPRITRPMSRILCFVFGAFPATVCLIWSHWLVCFSRCSKAFFLKATIKNNTDLL